MNMNQQRLSKTEEGMVAIFSVLMIMAIMTLLVIGFTNVVRQSQNRALNDQLNAQALYAAETAVNDATRTIKADINNLSAYNKTSCGPDATFNDYQLDAQLGIEYSCLLIDTSPPELRFDNVSDAVFSRINTSSGDDVDIITFRWDSLSPSHTANNLQFSAGCQVGNPTLPSASTWGNGIGMLRVDLIPANDYDRDDMVADSYSFYLFPTSNVCAPVNNLMSIDEGPVNHGSTLITRCTTTGDYRCTGRVRLAGSNDSDYFLRIQSFYNDVAVELSVITDAGVVAELVDGQVLVDATGRANNVFKRIRAYVPVGVTENYQNNEQNVFALLSGESICKRLVGAPPSGGVGGAVDVGGCGTLNP